MSKFCRQCGAQLEDDAVKCEACGYELVKPEADAQPAGENAAPAAAPKKLDNKMIGIIAGAAGVIVILIIVLVLVFSGGGYKKSIDNCIKALTTGDKALIEAAAPEEYWDYQADKTGLSTKKLIESYADTFDGVIDLAERSFGDNFKITYKIEDEDALSKSQLNNIRDTVNGTYEIANKSVTEGYELDLEITFKGKDDERSEDATVYVVKIDGKWYMCSKNGTLGPEVFLSGFMN